MAKKKKKKSSVKKSLKKNKSLHSLKFFLGLIFFLCLGFILLNYLENSQRTNSNQAIDYEESQKAKQEAFIQDLLPKAKELQQAYGVLPSIILGQAILESDWGNSRLANEFHNLFGIKAGPDQEKVHLETKEYLEGTWQTVTADFRVFANNSESLEAHTQLFVKGTTWNAKQYETVLLAPTYQQAAKALQTSGYATDPDYANKIIGVIESYHLAQYDSLLTTSTTSSE